MEDTLADKLLEEAYHNPASLTGDQEERVPFVLYADAQNGPRARDILQLQQRPNACCSPWRGTSLCPGREQVNFAAA